MWDLSSCWLEQRTHNPLVLCSTHRGPTIVYIVNRRLGDRYRDLGQGPEA